MLITQCLKTYLESQCVKMHGWANKYCKQGWASNSFVAVGDSTESQSGKFV